jgi:hypothetical protein
MIGAGAGGGQLAVEPGKPKEALAGAAGTTALSAVIPPLVKWIKASKTIGAKALQAASEKAGNAPVELSSQTNELVDKIIQQSKLGGGAPPKIITDLLDRVGPSTRVAAEANPGPLTYDEARILQGNASTLSVNEANNLKGQMKSLFPRFAKSFANDVQAAADAAGAGPEHAIGMQEYAAASSRNRALVKVGKAIPYVGGAAYAAHQIQSFLKK